MQTATTTSTKSLTKQINENVTPLVRSVVRCSHQPLRAFIRHRKSLTCPRATLGTTRSTWLDLDFDHNRSGAEMDAKGVK